MEAARPTNVEEEAPEQQVSPPLPPHLQRLRVEAGEGLQHVGEAGAEVHTHHATADPHVRQHLRPGMVPALRYNGLIVRSPRRASHPYLLPRAQVQHHARVGHIFRSRLPLVKVRLPRLPLERVQAAAEQLPAAVGAGSSFSEEAATKHYPHQRSHEWLQRSVSVSVQRGMESAP